MVRKIVFQFLYSLGIANLLLYLNRLRGRIPILVFHRVHPECDPYTEPIHPEHFEKILRFLVKHYEFISIDEYLKGQTSKKSCLITFDDATTDFAEYAYPILKKFNIPVTLFVPASAAVSGEAIWNYRYFEWMLSSETDKLTFEWGGEMMELDPGDTQQVKDLHTRLLFIPSEKRNGLLERIKSGLDVGESAFATTLTVSELGKLQKEGLVSIQSHGLDHNILTIESESTIQNELLGSKERIKSLNPKILAFAYPNGMYNDQVKNFTGKVYDIAFTTDDKLATREAGDKMAIPRLLIYYSDPKELMLRINGLQQLLALFRR